jgi:hypothetical protein
MNGVEVFVLGVGSFLTAWGAVKSLQGSGEQEERESDQGRRPTRQRETEPLSICIDCLSHTDRICRSCRRTYCHCRGKHCSECSGEILIYDEEVVVESW